MKDKLQQLPVGVVVAAVVGILALAGFAVFKSVGNQDGSYTVPMDRQRYMEEMKKRSGQGGGTQYSSQGAPGQKIGAIGGKSTGSRFGAIRQAEQSRQGGTTQ